MRSETKPMSSSEYWYKRGKWRRSVEFILTSLGFSVGVGTLWRFPYMAIRNGGGAFVFTYCVAVAVCALPLFLMEACLGQYFGRSALVAWDIVPLFKGLGIIATLISTCCSLYYNSMVGWTLYYTAMTFEDPLPWATCGNQWNTPSCVSLGGVLNESGSLIGSWNQSRGSVLSSEEYWQRHVLRISAGVEEVGSLNWKTSLCLCAAWLITFLVLCKGVHSSRLVVYVTATLPFLILVILMIKGATLPGALDGALFFIIPQWEKLGTYQVWLEGFLQGLYSLVPGWGSIITFASYNDFHNDLVSGLLQLVYFSSHPTVDQQMEAHWGLPQPQPVLQRWRETITMGVMDTLACILAGFAIFTLLGHASFITGVPIEELPNSGPGLAFVTYPFTAASLPVPQLWSFLLFSCVFFLAVDSQFGMVKVFITGICDAFPKTVGERKTLATLMFCVGGNILALLFMTEGGMYYYLLTDWYLGALSMVTVNFFQSFVLGWFYGIDRFLEHVREMMPHLSPKLLTALKYIWKYGTTISTFVVLVVTMVKLKAPTYSGYHYPGWAVATGWVISVLIVSPLPVGMVYVLWKQKGSLSKDGFPPLFYLVLPHRNDLPKTPSKPPHPVTLY